MRRRRSAARGLLAAAALLAAACVHPAREPAYAASVAFAAGDFETAAAQAERARAILEGRPDDAEWLRAVIAFQGEVEEKRDRPDAAAAFWHQLLDRSQRDASATADRANALHHLAQLAADRGSPDEARARWRELLALGGGRTGAPDALRARAWAGLARLARDEGDFAAADRLFRKAITSGSTTGPEFWPIRREYAALLRESGRLESAARVEEPVGVAGGFRTNYLWAALTWSKPLHPTTERVVRRWADERMPLRVYVPDPPAGTFADPGAAVRAVHDAVDNWRDVARPGVPSFVFVGSPGKADIPIRWGDALDDGILAQTEIPRNRRGHFQVDLPWRWAPGVPVPVDVLRAVATHEIGHALGLVGHSPDPADLMYPVYAGSERDDTLTERDKTTLRLLYRYQPGELVSREELRGAR